MENYICKIATRDELLKRWEYLIKIHSGNSKWLEYKERILKNFDEGSIIPYLGFIEDECICEATAYIDNSAFIGDISNPSGLLNKNMSYLSAFRTNKEYEGKGYFSKLFNFAENDLKERGYTALSVGVEPKEVRNLEIYFHLGFKEFIKANIEHNQFNDEIILFYKKNI
ncbi:MAG: GNAT family N-acetyltransferase [Clostridiales bacterium]|nr:GNAT family N-acetyltransferase [Clostridiales bacterium]